jgi:cell division protein FtsQ
MRRLTALYRKLKPGVSPPAGRGRPRRRAAPRWLRPALGYGAALTGLAVIIGGLAWAWTSGRAADQWGALAAAAVEASASAGLVVAEVFVAGRGQTARDDLIAALDVTLGAPLLAFDGEAARRRVEALGWVREATVERRFPDTLFLRIVERQPLALWQRDGRLVVVDREGAVIDGAAPERFARLPVIVGDDAPRHAARLLAVLASEPSLLVRVEAAVRVGGRRWNLRFDNGIDVELPEQGLAEAWRRLAAFERRHRLLARDITVIDLRLPDRVVVRPSGAIDGLDAAGENT